MTTPNVEELIERLRDPQTRGTTGEWFDRAEGANALQSQAEHIAELERESETHAKAYGLAIVERDNLRHELKTAQEGWRCECSTDDACRFARERDALRAQLAEIAATEPVAWINLAASCKMFRFLAPTEECGTVTKDWQPLFTRPMPAQDGDAPALSVIKRLLKVHEDRGDADAESLAKVMLEDAKGAK